PALSHIVDHVAGEPIRELARLMVGQILIVLANLGPQAAQFGEDVGLALLLAKLLDLVVGVDRDDHRFRLPAIFDHYRHILIADIDEKGTETVFGIVGGNGFAHDGSLLHKHTATLFTASISADMVADNPAENRGDSSAVRSNR